MHNQCKDSGCSCCCHSQDSSCHKDSTCHESHGNECDFETYLFSIADKAWEKLLTEKIKARIEATSGDKLNELAQIISDGNKERWEQKMLAKKKKCDFDRKLKEFFGSECSDKSCRK